MKKTGISAGSIFWGLLLIGVATVLILEGIGVGDFYGVSVPAIALGILLICWFVYLVVKKKFYLLFLPLGLFYTFVVDKPLAQALKLTNLKEDGRIIPIWIVILASVLLCIAFKVLFTKKTVVVNGGASNPESRRVGNSTLYFDAKDLSCAEIKENIGSMTVYITNKDCYEGGGVIKIHENVGTITLHLPANWLVVTNVSESIGRVSVPEQTGPTDKSITLVVTETVGRVNVVFDA